MKADQQAWDEWQERIRNDKAGRLGYVSSRDHFEAGFLAARLPEQPDDRKGGTDER